MVFLVDFLTWIAYLYSQSYIRQPNEVLSLLLFSFASVGFFLSDDFISTALFFEFQNVPLLFLLNTRYKNPTKMAKTITPLKGIGFASFLLLFYGLVSGLFLFYGFQILYSHSLNSSISLTLQSLRDVALLQTGSNGLSWALFSIFLSGCIKLALFPFHV